MSSTIIANHSIFNIQLHHLIILHQRDKVKSLSTCSKQVTENKLEMLNKRYASSFIVIASHIKISKGNFHLNSSKVETNIRRSSRGKIKGNLFLLSTSLINGHLSKSYESALCWVYYAQKLQQFKSCFVRKRWKMSFIWSSVSRSAWPRISCKKVFRVPVGVGGGVEGERGAVKLYV